MAQALRAPLGVGEQLTVAGTIGPGARLFVRAEARDEVLVARFDDLGLQAGGQATVTVGTRRGRPRVRLTQPTGRTVAPARVQRFSLRRPARVRRLSARRSGRRVRISFLATSRAATLQLDGPGGPPTTRVVRTRPGRRVRLALRRPRARRVTVAALGTGGLPSARRQARVR